jgi:hypothetical protein
MIHTVIPVKNEAKKIKQTLQMLLSTHTDKILVIFNGCQDDSFYEVQSLNDARIEWVYFNKPLGIDIPRGVGTWIAAHQDTEGIIFVDGDMNGNLQNHINKIIFSLKNKKLDMALTNCYPEKTVKSTMAKILLSFRKQLNLELKIYNKIGYAIPSHGPHGISRKFIEKVPLEEICIPPVSLALAVKQHLFVDVATCIPAELLQSTIRDEFHANQIAKTIIGDCIEALQVFMNKERTRGYDGITFTGYHKNRRFDILEAFKTIGIQCEL